MDIAVNDLTAARNAVKSDDFIAAVELPSGVSASAVSSQAVDCLGVTGGTAVEDVCGICDGDGTSCLDCMGVPNGNAVLDQCDVCNGDGSSCIASADSNVVAGKADDSSDIVKTIIVKMIRDNKYHHHLHR